MKKYLIGALALSAIVTSTYADCQSYGCYDVQITSMYIANDGNVYIETSGDESVLACTSPSNVFVTLTKNAVAQKEIYSALLTAKTTKSTVRIRTDDASPICEVSYITF